MISVQVSQSISCGPGGFGLEHSNSSYRKTYLQRTVLNNNKKESYTSAYDKYLQDTPSELSEIVHMFELNDLTHIREPDGRPKISDLIHIFIPRPNSFSLSKNNSLCNQNLEILTGLI